MAKYNSKRAYGDCEGPFGFPMPSAVAKEVERIQKGLPQEIRDMGYQKRTTLAPMDIAEGERADISLITSDAVDRDREVMIPKGGNWKQFEKNPVVTFAHAYDQLPVGRALWVKAARDDKTNGWLAKTQYTERPEDWEGPWFPDAVWHFVKSGDLAGKSIGFLPLDGSPPDEKEIKARPELAGVQFVIRKWLALEYAVAPVQSNPDAIVIAVGKAHDAGLEIPSVIFEQMGLVIPTGTVELDWKSMLVDEPEPEPEPVPTPKAKTAPRRIITAESLAREITGANIDECLSNAIARLRGRV